jgi:hypothetical protein
MSTAATVTALPTGTIDVVLDRAADYLTRNGWDPTGPYEAHNGCTEKSPCRITDAEKCWPRLTGRYPASMIGAVRVAVFGHPRWYLDTAESEPLHDYTVAVEWLNTYLIAHGHAGKHASVFDWETTPGRTRIHVITALRYAATAYRRHTSRRAS